MRSRTMQMREWGGVGWSGVGYGDKDRNYEMDTKRVAAGRGRQGREHAISYHANARSGFGIKSYRLEL
jgi:hypothetical protein